MRFFNWLADRDYCPRVKIKVATIDDEDAARGEPLLNPQYKAKLDAVSFCYEGVQAGGVKWTSIRYRQDLRRSFAQRSRWLREWPGTKPISSRGDSMLVSGTLRYPR